MYYAATQQITDARHIARSAQQQIKNRTGMQVTMVLYPAGSAIKTPERMLHVIALALNEDPRNYKQKTRVRNVVELRFIAALCLRSNFPTITLQQIAAHFGGQDHTSIINGIARAHELIYAGDDIFLKKYKTAVAALNSWLRNDSEKH